MSNSSDQTFDRILQSLKDNSAEFRAKRRRQKHRHIYNAIISGSTFVAGVVLGVLVKLRFF